MVGEACVVLVLTIRDKVSRWVYGRHMCSEIWKKCRAAVVAVTVVGSCCACGDDEPTAEAEPDWPTFHTASELLDAATRAGLTGCPDPTVLINASYSFDQLGCGNVEGLSVKPAARLYRNEVDQAYDIDGQRELAGIRLADGDPVQSILIGPSEVGPPFWLLIGPIDELRLVAEELGGDAIDLALPWPTASLLAS